MAGPQHAFIVPRDQKVRGQSHVVSKCVADVGLQCSVLARFSYFGLFGGMQVHFMDCALIGGGVDCLVF